MERGFSYALALIFISLKTDIINYKGKQTMANMLANSVPELDQIKNLLNKKMPPCRLAYSDRAAWVMACISELAYIRFNPLFSNGGKQKDYFLENILKLIDDNKKSSLLKLLDLVGYDPDAEKKKLVKELGLLGLELLETFDSNGTQAILVSFDKFIVLAFRGTEAKSIKDIKADAKANITSCETGGKIHSGFKEAFEEVNLDIQAKLDEDQFQDRPLFITGHSLGGALATVAAKKLTHKCGIAGCYTYGAPRVGDEEWVSQIKTPVYRLVNAADCVTMLPPGAETITIIAWVLQYIPEVGDAIRKRLLSSFGGYLHGGNMRYLTNCANGDYNNVKLLYSVSILYRIKGVIIKKLPWKKTLADHAISTYRKKLAIVAETRNA